MVNWRDKNARWWVTANISNEWKNKTNAIFFANCFVRQFSPVWWCACSLLWCSLLCSSRHWKIRKTSFSLPSIGVAEELKIPFFRRHCCCRLVDLCNEQIESKEISLARALSQQTASTRRKYCFCWSPTNLAWMFAHFVLQQHTIQRFNSFADMIII